MDLRELFEPDFPRGTRPKRNGKVGVEVKITITGKIVHFYTGIDVSPELWIPSVGKQKGNNAENRLINKMLDVVMEEIDSSYNTLLFISYALSDNGCTIRNSQQNVRA